MVEKLSGPRILVNWSLSHEGKRYKSQLEQLGDSRILTIERHGENGEVIGKVQITQSDRDFTPLLTDVSGFVKSIGL